ncbi:MAG TPA: M20/M25/M40 family metallo-hydrolase [Gemmatimonadaceae bacterium]|nr:M20/M25/M40 family metallo-hydrolase [Gemmatimonadaceae bacterium]
MNRIRLLVVACLMLSLPLGAQTPRPIDPAALRDETARLLAEYLRVNTTNPPGNELATARWLQGVLAKEGIEAQILDTAELGAGRANLYARLRGNGSKKALALVHHMDVVPVFRDQWTVDPFGGVTKDGYVWGRGALDDKGQGIVHLMTMIALKRAGVPLARDLVFIANADEESDGTGAIAFVKRHADLLRDVEFLVTEGGGTRVDGTTVRWFGLGVGEKRPYWVRLTARGTTAHASVPSPDNPVPRLARAVARLAAWQTPVRVLPSVQRYFAAQAKAETNAQHRRWLADARAALATPRGRAWLLSDPARNALLRNTVTPTVFNGSTKTNVIPPVATAEVDIRLLPDQDTAAFHRALVRTIADTSIAIEVLPGVTPEYAAPLGTDFVRAVERTAAALVPGAPVATPIEAGASDRPTYAQVIAGTYGVDPFLVDQAEERRGYHGNDERVSVANLEFGVRFFVRLVQELQ